MWLDPFADLIEFDPDAEAYFTLGSGVTPGGQPFGEVYEWEQPFNPGWSWIDLFAFTVTGGGPDPEPEPCCPEVPEPEVATPCPPATVYMGSPCHAPDCIQQWEDGPAMWDSGGTWWDCEEGPDPDPGACLYPYWRVRRLQPSSGWMSLNYFAFLGPSMEELVPQPPVGAIGQGVPEDAFTPGGGMWEYSGQNAWVGYHFDVPLRPTYLGFLTGWGGEFPTEFALEGSEDGNEWVEVMRYAEGGDPGESVPLVYPVIDCDGNLPDLPGGIF